VKRAAEAAVLVEQGQAVGLRYTCDGEARRDTLLLDLEDVGEVGIDLDDEPRAHERGREARDGDVVVERPRNPAVELEEQGCFGDRSAGIADGRTLKSPLASASTRPLAAEKLPRLAPDHHPVGREHSGVAGEQAVQFVCAQLSVETARERDAVAIRDLDRVRKPTGTHRGT
jgi:hypothetical protein